MTLTTVSLASPKTSTTPATFTITSPVFDGVALVVAENIGPTEVVKVLGHLGYSVTDAVNVMAAAATRGAFTYARTTLN